MPDIAGGPQADISIGITDNTQAGGQSVINNIKKVENQIAKSLGISEDAWDKLGKAAQAAAVKNVAATDLAIAKTLELEAATKKLENQTKATRATRSVVVARGKAEVNRIGAQEDLVFTKESERRITNLKDQEEKRRSALFRHSLSIQRKDQEDYESWYKKVLKARSNADNAAAQVRHKSVQAEATLFGSIIKRSRGGSPEFEQAVKGAISGFGPAFARQQAVKSGATLEEAFINQLREAVGGLSARALVVPGVSKTPSMGGAGGASGGGGKGGILSGLLRRLGGAGGGGVAGSLIGGLLGGIGVGVGGYALANAGQAVIDATKTATAYERQTVAARNLAGGQAQLNQLLAVFQKESGGAVSKVDSLAAVTRLLATGFAKNANDLGKFTRATRGAAIALGRTQEETTQDIQLAISNTSVKRLDQIGLGIKEVQDRTAALRKENKGLQREQAFGVAVMQLLDEKYGKLSKTAEGQATGLEKLAKAWDDLTLAMGKNAKSPVNRGAQLLTGIINSLNAPIKSEAENLTGISGPGRMLNPNNFFDQLTVFLKGYDRREVSKYNADQLLANGGGSSLTRYHGSSPTGVSGPSLSRWDALREEQQQVLTQAYKQSIDMEKQYNKRREDEIRSFNESVASSEKNFHKSQLREEEDFARSRARAQRDYEKQIVNVMRDAQERDAGYKSDLDKTIAKNTKDSNKRLQDINDNYRDQEEKANKAHRLSMLKAAGQLDAMALLDERLSAKLDQDERKKDHEKQIKDEKEALAERIQDAKDAYQEQLDNAHKADKKRIDEMAADRKQQIADENEDRAIQKARAIEDHNDELAEMTRVHNEKMDKITQEYNDQVKAFQDALADDLAAVGIYLDGYQEKLDARNNKILDFYDKIADKIEKAMKLDQQISKGANAGSPVGPVIPQYASGGPVGRTGIALLHAGEYVVPASLAHAVQQNNYGASSSKTVQIHSGAFQVYTTPGMEVMVGKVIEDILLEHLEAAA